MQKIKKNDSVVILAGKDKGKHGKVIRVLGQRCLVAGVNRVKKHQRSDPRLNVQGGIIEKEAPIHLSNVALADEEGNASRVGFRIEGEGESATKVRFFKTTNKTVSQ